MGADFPDAPLSNVGRPTLAVEEEDAPGTPALLCCPAGGATAGVLDGRDTGGTTAATGVVVASPGTVTTEVSVEEA